MRTWLDRYRNLQGSQTMNVKRPPPIRLDRYRNLQGSQTIWSARRVISSLDRYRNLQGSQTQMCTRKRPYCLTDIVIYKVLKPCVLGPVGRVGLTDIVIYKVLKLSDSVQCVPPLLDRYRNLQGSQTDCMDSRKRTKLDRYRNLQGSQTLSCASCWFSGLDRYRNLQGSQTNI